MIETLAAEAAAHWRGTPLRLVRNRENAVFEMALPGGRRAALRLPAEWRTYGFQESAGPALFRFERQMSLSGYFTRQLILTFDLAEKDLVSQCQADH